MEVSHKARKIIEAEISNRPGDSAAALYAVRALDRAGLLAPGTPETDGISANETPVWRSDRCLMTTVVRESRPVRMWIPNVGELAYSPQDARQQAHMLLAAANHTEQEQPSGSV